MKGEIDLSIIIVTWNSEQEILACLDSVKNAAGGTNCEIFVVDNASIDATVNIITTSFPEVRLIKNSSNLGFAKANNLALKVCKGDNILLLNPDTILNDRTLRDSIAYMKNNPAAGVIGCAIHNPDRSQQFSIRKFPSLLSQLLILCKLHNFFPRLKPLSKYFALEFDYSKEQEVDQVMGAYMFIRGICLKEVGFLDEGFWIWFEDVDYCKRVTESGWKVMYVPDILIIHNQSTSFARLLAVQEQRIFNKSMLYYIRKHHGNMAYMILKIFEPLSLMLSAIVGIFENKLNKISIK
jgi:hypothetical protein